MGLVDGPHFCGKDVLLAENFDRISKSDILEIVDKELSAVHVEKVGPDD